MKTKRCTKCEKTKEISNFSKMSTGKFGVCAWCKSCKNGWDNNYSKNHRQEAIERAKKWYANNKDKMAEWGRNYRKKNAERIKAKKAEYSKTHQHERNALEHKREAIKKGNGGTYTKQQFIDLCQKYDNKCLMCERSDVKLTVDHVIPIALGGSNYIENIQPLCLSCNSKKHTTILDLR